MSIRLICLAGAALCMRLGGSEAQASASGPEELRIVCDGITTATLAGQDILYSGRSEFEWATLRIRVDGQLHVFCGASVTQTDSGIRARFEIQSLTANGSITASWNDGSTERHLQGTRMIIRPESSLTNSDSVILHGPTGKLSWDPDKRQWIVRPSVRQP